MKHAGVEEKVSETLAVEAKAAEVKALETARTSAMGTTISFVGGSRGGTAASVVRR